MTTRIAFLRGINVGSRNRLPMQNLKEALAALGCRQVRTYIQSGNAVFVAPDSREDLGQALSTALEDELGFAPGVIVLERDQLEAAVRANPFSPLETATGSVHLFFMGADPQPDAHARLDALKSPSESLRLKARVLYLSAPDGIGRSRLVKSVDKALGTPATGRNWQTVTRLLEMSA
jgi:uncharacterized protein (DUF1697 family)